MLLTNKKTNKLANIPLYVTRKKENHCTLFARLQTHGKKLDDRSIILKYVYNLCANMFISMKVGETVAATTRVERQRPCSLFVWLVADGWCWFVLREKYS
jgi:hypothetical protein